MSGFANLRQPAENHEVAIRPSVQQAPNSPSQARLQQNQDGLPENQNQDGLPENRNLSAQQRAGSVSLAAEQETRSSQFDVSTPQTTVRLLAPEIDWNYAVIERQDPDTLKTTLIPFDLGKLVLQHDASQDLELQAGDVVSIFSDADIQLPIAQQTKLVKLEGEFVHPGSYTVQPGETLRQLVKRAGGFTPDAYLYASEFSRESTRSIQQERIDEYVQSLDMGLQRSNLALAASSSQGLASSATTAQSSEQNLLARLRQIRATGRIVLAFKANSSSVDILPEIAMENGDHFVVPHVPAIVNVVGAVYDQNSFLYTQMGRAGTYLQLAGGPNRDADRKREFIIRADGEVVSRDAVNGLWGNKFDNLRLYPGDTIVVPDKTFKPSALRGVLDWSQMFSQFALGAAALSVIQ